MNPKKWLPRLDLFKASSCVYCGGVADSSDHTPPRCFLPRKLPTNLQAMTVPACSACNSKYQKDEQRAAAIVTTVSFTESDRRARAEGGWLHSAMERDVQLRHFIGERLGSDGIFRPDQMVIDVIARVMKKTTSGLLFYEFGRYVHPDKLTVIAIDHAKNIHPSALAEMHRREDSGWAEVTPSGRELERQVVAAMGGLPPNMPAWHTYLPEVFEYIFLRRSNRKLMCGINLHDSLTVLLECPWPVKAGPLRGARPSRKA